MTAYANEAGTLPCRYKVTFLNETNQKLTRGFDSEYLARKFVQKIKHSKRCTLISYPLFT